MIDLPRASKSSLRGLLTAAALLGVTACSEKVEGPKPSIDPPSASASPPPVDPEIVCRAQLTTEVTLHGTRLSPVPIDIPKDPKLALPTVTLSRTHELDGAGASSADVVVYSGDADADPTNAVDEDGELITVDGKPLLNWKSQQEMSLLVTQSLVLGEKPAKGEDDTRMAGMLPEGVWDVKIENANGFGTESLGALAVVDKPELETPSPGVVCLDQGAREVTLTGRTFLRNGDVKAELEIEGVAPPFAMTLADCTAIEHEGLDAEVCASASVMLDEGSVAVGFPGLVVQNPETAACASVDDRKLRVVPPPTIDTVEAPLACVAQGARQFVINGKDFLRIDDTDPMVTVGDMAFAVDMMGGCEALETQGHEVQACSSINITIAENALPPDLYAVTVQNPQPAGCESTATGLLRIVPPPAVEEIEPALVCLDDGAREVVVTGQDFLVVDAVKPAVEVDGEALDPGDVVMEGCSALDTDRLMVQQCDTLVLTLAEGSVDLGMPEIRVENPSPAGCDDRRDDLLTVVPGPTIEGAEPALLCTVDDKKKLTITGTGFLSVGDELPAVQIAGDDVDSVDSVDDCEEVTVNGLEVQTCTTLVVTVAEDSLDEGLHEIEVRNPDPAGCTATRDEALTVPPELEIATLVPLNVCKDDANATLALTLTGAGFLDVEGELPTVTFAVGTAEEAEVTPTLSECEDLAVDGLDDGDVQTCEQLDVTVNLTSTLTASAGVIPITVQNSNAPACELEAMIALNVVEPPSVLETCNEIADTGPGTGTDPCIEITDAPSDSEVCSDLAFTLVITGSGFVEGATVTLDNEDDDLDTEATVVVDSATQVTATFSSGVPFNKDDTDYDLMVANAGNCAGPVVEDAIDVNPTPLVFFVDPPVVYNELSVDVTVFAAGLSVDSALDKIEIIDALGEVDELVVVSNTKPSRIVVNVPNVDMETSMPYLPGEYTVRVTSVLGCAGELPGGLEITQTVALTNLAIDPSFASSTEPTAVTITADASPGFGDAPRVYLSPLGGGTAEALRAVVVSNDGKLTAVIPAGLTPGEYSLIVVNSDGEVGLIDASLVDAVFVTAAEPPVVTAVEPAYMPGNEDMNMVTITGENFDMAGGVDVYYECVAPGGAMSALPVSSVTVDNATQISAVVDSNSSSDGTICTVTVTNLTDTAQYTFSAIAIRNNDNLNAWSPQEPMQEPRRALALLASRPTQTSRFLHAIGGDDGARANAKTSVESVSVDVFGELTPPWFTQQNALPEARTAAGFARIGDFLYLTGGFDGTAAQNSVLRAQVLDPLAGPEITDVDAVLGDPDAEPDPTGLPGALWQYQVAYVYPADDPNSPSGESIAGELLNVQLPDRPEGIVMSLSWDEAENVSGDPLGYNVYRTISDDMSGIELLATCPGDAGCVCTGTGAGTCTYTDDNTQDTTTGETPLPPGSLGVWHQPYIGNITAPANQATMVTAREGHATVAVKHPHASHVNDWVLYSFGGRDTVPAVRGDYEFSIVTVDPVDGTQSMSAWTTGNRGLGTVPKADLAAWVATPEDTAFVPAGTVAVFLGTGYTNTTGTTTAELVSGSLTTGSTGGQLVTVDGTNLDVENGPQARAATCYGGAGPFVNLFGGETNATFAGLAAADRAGTITDAGANDPNTEASWNAPGGGSLAIRRAYCATTQESAFYFTAGGRTDEGGAPGLAASTSVERTVE